MLSGIGDCRISNRNRKVKFKYFLKERIDDVFDYIKIVLGKLVNLKKYIEDNGKSSETVIKTNGHFHG